MHNNGSRMLFTRKQALHYALSMTAKSNDAGKSLALDQGSLTRSERYLKRADELIIGVSFSSNNTDALAYWKDPDNVGKRLGRAATEEHKVKAILDFYVSLKSDKEVMQYDKNLGNEHEWSHLLNTWAYWEMAAEKWKKAYRAWFDVDTVAGVAK